MGWIYRKRLRLGPLRISLSRSGIATSWGVPGFRLTHSSTGRRYITLSLPGTGLSWRKTLSRSRRGSGRQIIPAPTTSQSVQASPQPPAQPTPSSSQTATGTSGPLVNGVPWWQQAGVKGPGTGP